MNRFALSNKQKKPLRRFLSYLRGEWESKPKTKEEKEDDVEMTEAIVKEDHNSTVCSACRRSESVCKQLWEGLLLPSIRDYHCKCSNLAESLEAISKAGNQVRRSNKKVEKEYMKQSGGGSLAIFSSSICFPLAKEIKAENALRTAEHLAKSLVGDRNAKAQELLEGESPEVRVLDVQAKSGFVNFLLSGRESFACSCKASRTVRRKKKEDGKKFKEKSLTIEMMPSSFLEEEFQLYRKYQVSVHNDKDVNPEEYKRFLVESPIDYESLSSITSSQVPNLRSSTHMPCEIPKFTGYGSFHQQYRLDGKLVAVGVIDVMKNCLSSKYFFWDPELAFLELGKVSSLAEIDFVMQAKQYQSSLHYYYQGYYIHTCPKMAYKADYKPAELLCPNCLRWVDFDDKLRRKMRDNGGRLLTLCEDEDCQRMQMFEDEENEAKSLIASKRHHDITCMVYGQSVPFGKLLQVVDPKYIADLEGQVSKWVAACGPQAANMVYKMN